MRQTSAALTIDKDLHLERLNNNYRNLTPEQRLEQLYKDFDKVFFTSSFGTTSVILLHLISKVNPDQEVHFIDTTYHFAETLAYRDYLQNHFGLKIINILPEPVKNNFTRNDRTWEKNPEHCCHINKVEPVDLLKPAYDVWISGLMGNQSSNRSRLDVFEQKPDILKFYPLIDLSQQRVDKLMSEIGLPRHPLQDRGYNSIGCTHCTRRGEGRGGRWSDFDKVECGLHV